MRQKTVGILSAFLLVLAFSTSTVAQAETDEGTFSLPIFVRNCEEPVTVFYTQPQEGCVPGDGAFFNVYSDSGEFLGNCEANRSAANPNPIYAGCTVEVPFDSTGVITEGLASIPESYAPTTNSRPFFAPSAGPATGEDFFAIFVNVLQADAEGDGSVPTELPNTGTGASSDSSAATPWFAAIATLCLLTGVRIARHVR